jgi:hypothetical protein
MAVVLKSQTAIQSSRLRGGPVGSKIKMLLRLTVGLVALTSLGQQALGCTCAPPDFYAEPCGRLGTRGYSVPKNLAPTRPTIAPRTTNW